MKEIENTPKKICKPFFIIVIIIFFTVSVLYVMNYYNLSPKEYYRASDFNIKTVYSKSDFDKDNVDDYTDFVLGARRDAKNHPTYISKYYADAYPPDNEGVCTDTIWRAFKNAGYSLKDMVDNDIKKNLTDYSEVEKIDSNIDFRRVGNLKVFFSKYAQNLTLDYKELESWQPGDIVIFGNKHIGIISDRRNKEGIPYVIHNYGQPIREEEYLTKTEITHHFRFDATQVDKEILIPWSE